mgnify:FL=1
MGKKTGKKIKIPCCNENLNCFCGAIENYKSPKSIYVVISSWVLPKKQGNYNRIITSFEIKIKKLIKKNNFINNEIFDDFYILDLDLRASGIRLNKKSFISLEFNLYQKGAEIDYLPLILNDNKKYLFSYITKMVNDITLSELFINNEFFDFYSTKTKIKTHLPYFGKPVLSAGKVFGRN